MGADYIPDTDCGAVAWMQTFACGIAEAPGAYQLCAADAGAIVAAVDAFAAALAVSSDPATRTTVTVAAKDEARNAAKQLCRRYAMIIKPNAGVGNAAKIAIGVRPMNPSRQRIAPPSTSPVVEILAATYGMHTLRFADSMNTTRRAKPFGAARLQLFRHIGDDPGRDAEQALFYGAFTTSLITVAFETKDGGKFATYFASWPSRRGETGPWSNAKSLRIAA